MIQIIECEQGTEEWCAARLGIPTASKFATVMAKGKEGGASKTRSEYMRKLAGELLTGEQMDCFTNHHTERGKVMEDEARTLYAFMRDCEPQTIGFIRNGQKGCSPDSLIGKDGGLEIKTALPHIQVERLLAGTCHPSTAPRFKATSGLPSANGGTSFPTGRAFPCWSSANTATKNISPSSHRRWTSSTKSLPSLSSASAALATARHCAAT
jgi:hypothetical protein